MQWLKCLNQSTRIVIFQRCHWCHGLGGVEKIAYTKKERQVFSLSYFTNDTNDTNDTIVLYKFLYLGVMGKNHFFAIKNYANVTLSL